MNKLWDAYDFKTTNLRLKDEERGIMSKTTGVEDVHAWEDYACEVMTMGGL